MGQARDEQPTSEPRHHEPLRARLRELARLLPEGATLSLDRFALERLVGPEGDDFGSAGSRPDCTVGEAAERLRLSKNRVRSLIAEGKLEAYRIAGVGGWRVTPAALDTFRRAGVPHVPTAPSPRVDLGRWRRVRREES